MDLEVMTMKECSTLLRHARTGDVLPDTYLGYSFLRGKVLRGDYDKFPDFFRMVTFVDSTHMKL